jgi:hypothetical protein
MHSSKWNFRHLKDRFRSYASNVNYRELLVIDTGARGTYKLRKQSFLRRPFMKRVSQLKDK